MGSFLSGDSIIGKQRKREKKIADLRREKKQDLTQMSYEELKKTIEDKKKPSESAIKIHGRSWTHDTILEKCIFHS